MNTLLRFLSPLLLLTPQTACASSLIKNDPPNVPPSVPPNINECHFQYYEQQVDHFGKHNGTFKQKYNLILDFFKPGGPIFFFQGEETTYLECVGDSVGYSWAQKTNGIAVILEHRYFGESVPLNATNITAQLPEFSYLTLDNVMADAASFLRFLKQNVTGAAESKAIVYSGSYGAFLATVFRQNRPDDFYGAVASAAPVDLFGGNLSVAGAYNWNIWAICGNASSLALLKSELALCTEPTKDDFAAIYFWFKQVLNVASEFNYPVAHPGRSPVATSLEKVINIALTQSDPIQVINETIWLWFDSTGLSCIDYSKPSTFSVGIPLIQSRLFAYVICVYFPLSAASNVPNETMLRPDSSTALGSTTSCKNLYNITTPSFEALQTRYKYSPEHLRNSTRIIWTLGEYDPTSGVAPNQPGVDAPSIGTNRNASRILYVSDMAHREDLFAPSEGDRSTVVQARATELEIIKGWLGWHDQ